MKARNIREDNGADAFYRIDGHQVYPAWGGRGPHVVFQGRLIQPSRHGFKRPGILIDLDLADLVPADEEAAALFARLRLEHDLGDA